MIDDVSTMKNVDAVDANHFSFLKLVIRLIFV